jgi:hypothetical protein
MKLNYILEVMETAQSRLGNGQMDYIEAINEAIDELKKVIAENDKIKVMGASAPAKEEPQDEIVHIEPFFNDTQEKAFWEKCYVMALNCGYANLPQQIADKAVFECRRRAKVYDV